MNLSLHALKTMVKKIDCFEPTGDSFIDWRYDLHNIDYGHFWCYYRLFYRLSQVLKPKLVVELGGYQGTAAAHFASGNERATVITIDHHTDPGDEINQAKMLEVSRRYTNVWYIQGWTTRKLANEQKGRHYHGDARSAYPKVIDIMNATGSKIDILFIDSWHHYDKALDDWLTYSPLLAKPSLVICDDIQDGGDSQSPISGMLDFWNDLRGEKFLDGNIHPGTNMGFMIYDA